MLLKKVKTVLEVAKGDRALACANYGNVRDVSFKNNGTGNAFLVFDNGQKAELNASDPMLSIGGYDDAVRADEFRIEFAGVGTKRVEVYFTILVC